MSSKFEFYESKVITECTGGGDGEWGFNENNGMLTDHIEFLQCPGGRLVNGRTI